MKTFRLSEIFGSFPADGEEGAKFRFCEVEPALSAGHQVIFDFEGVTNMTDSFCNACFGILSVTHPGILSGKAEFRNCSPLIQGFLISAFSLMSLHPGEPA